VDKVDSLDFYINVPAGNKAASNGLLMDTLLVGNTITYHWRERYPIANYLIAMAVTNYYAYADTVPTRYGNIYVLNYCYPEDTASWHSGDSNVAASLQLYSGFFGQYPFIKEKYGHAEFNWQGGMEHQTMSFVCCMDYELINHEMGHQWFGDKLTCGSWSDIWLNEGFAVYLSALCYQYLAPEWWMPWRTTTLASIIANADKGSVYCTDTNSVSRIFYTPISYRKGAYILHMLRWELGDSIFFAGIRSYVSDTALTYGFSKTEMLEQHLETASGRDLSTFFSNWFDGVGYPSYALDWSAQGSAVSCRLSQVTSDASVGFYAMDVPVRFYGDHTDTTVILHHNYNGQIYTAEVDFNIDSVVIDPDLWLLSANNNVRKLPSLSSADFLVVYPNPVSDMMTIWYDSQNLHDVSYTICDMDGNKVKEAKLIGGNDYYSTSLSGLSGGVYIIKVDTGSGSISQRIIKY
jgi:aminopeptidase N